jgi:two-component system, NtrC family, response regulator GlrR
MSGRFRDDDPSQGETARLEELAGEVRWRRFRITVSGGPQHGMEAISDGAELGIGTARGNQLVLTDDAVSRHHCVVTHGERGVWLRDLESTNGTRVGGLRVGSVRLKSGTVFTVGRTTLRFERLADEVKETLSRAPSFGPLLGKSAAMRRIFAMLPRIAQSDTTVLLEGETGTGKTLIAAAVHDASPRASGPFVVVDCGALTPTLVESHLFGHARGAFTGAESSRTGAFEEASGGTIFIDEVGELPLGVQPKLLRVLEQREVTPLGKTRPTPVDVRVVAATNRDLREEVNRGGFRADLFYRLAVVRLLVPPLRDRPEDVEQLVRFFHAEIAPDAAPLPAELVELWKGQRWSGNVRELRSAIERAVLLGDAAREPGAAPPSSFREAKERIIESFERAYVTELVAQHGGNLSQAARAARMDRNHLRELLRRYGVGY